MGMCRRECTDKTLQHLQQQLLKLEAKHEQQQQQQQQQGQLEAKSRRKQEHQQMLIEEFCQAQFVDEVTAIQHLEAAGWSLERATASYMPPVPESPVAGWPMQTFSFKASYDRASSPEGPMDLEVLLGELIRGYCLQEGIQWGPEDQALLKEVHCEAMRNMDDLIAEAMYASVAVASTAAAGASLSRAVLSTS